MQEINIIHDFLENALKQNIYCLDFSNNICFNPSINNNYYTFLGDFNSNKIQVEDIIKKVNKQIIILDQAYNLEYSQSDLSQDSMYSLVTDHINLSQANPTLGYKPVKFYGVNNLYVQPEPLNKLSKSKTACLDVNIKPDSSQIVVLKEINIQNYSYNLVLASLLCAYHDIQVIGILVY